MSSFRSFLRRGQKPPKGSLPLYNLPENIEPPSPHPPAGPSLPSNAADSPTLPSTPLFAPSTPLTTPPRPIPSMSATPSSSTLANTPLLTPSATPPPVTTPPEPEPSMPAIISSTTLANTNLSTPAPVTIPPGPLPSLDVSPSFTTLRPETPEAPMSPLHFVTPTRSNNPSLYYTVTPPAADMEEPEANLSIYEKYVTHRDMCWYIMLFLGWVVICTIGIVLVSNDLNDFKEEMRGRLNATMVAIGNGTAGEAVGETGWEW